MIDLLAAGKERCCGCGTCALVCPTKAISMEPLELGCLYPRVDAAKCVECRLCAQNCAYQSEREIPEPTKQAFAAAAADGELLKKSSSGGVFAVLARRVLASGGVVCGCSMENVAGKLTPMHICVYKPEDLPKLQGSKYVQSLLGTVFSEVKQLLQQGRTVLFSGTPCQVDSLNHFLGGIDTSNLFTVDIICHGVPSAQLFQEYLDVLGKKRVSAFSFRDKTYGWGLNARYILQSGERYKSKLLSPGLSSFYTYFLSSEIYRESCYSCKYANTSRVGDITIGDFWGIEKEYPEYLSENGGKFNLQDGISAILVNSSKGMELLNRYGDSLARESADVEKIVRWNRQLREASKHFNTRDSLIGLYAADGYKGVEEKFRRDLGIRYYIRKVKGILKEGFLKK